MIHIKSIFNIDIQRLATIKDKVYSRKKPNNIVGLDDTLDHEIINTLEGCWSQEHSFQSKDIILICAENSVITSMGCLILNNQYLIKETLNDLQDTNKLDCYIKSSADSYSLVKPPHIIESNETVIPLLKPGYRNYGHWLVEMLPRVFIAQKHIKGKYKILIGKLEGRIKDIVYEMLKFNNINYQEIIELTHVTRFRKIYYISPISKHPNWHHPILKEFICSQLNKNHSISSQKKIFITRENVKWRNLKEQSSIISYLKSKDFNMINTFNLSYQEQIETFSNASIIIGVSGAAMTNTIFSPSGTTIIHLLPKTMPNYFYWDLANLFHHNYYEIRGDDQGTMYSDFTIDFSFFKNEINKILFQ